MNIYEITHQADCPNGELKDVYEIMIRSEQTIMVEEIRRTIKAAPPKIYQEDLATFLRSKLGAEITVVGWHHGIKITSHRQ
jgi:hypothetical protein